MAGLLLRHGVFVVVAVLYWVAPGSPPPGLALTSLLGGWSVFRLVARGSGSGWSVLDLVVVSAYLVSTPWLVVDSSFVSDTSAMLAVAGTAVISFTVAVPPRWSAVATVVVVAAWVVGCGLAGIANPFTIFSLDFLVVEWAMAAALRWSLMRSARLVDTALAAVSQVRVGREVTEARRRAERAQWASMHDTAASTLLMVGQGAVGDPETLRGQTRRDMDAIGALAVPREAGVVDVAAAVRAVGAGLSTDCVVTGCDSLDLAGELGVAVVAAVGESLVNVDRHARAQGVVVTLSAGCIEIVDDGVGFDPDAPRVRRRHGVRNSIQRRLADVGASVEIDTAPGAGTRIVMRWDEAPVEADPVALEPSSSVAGVLQLARGYGYGLLVIAAVVVLMQSPRAVFGPGSVVPEHAAVVAVMVAMCAVAGVGLRRRMSNRARQLAALVVVAAVPVQGLLLPQAQVFTAAYWALGAAGWPVAALTARLPLRQSLCWLAAVWVVGSAVVLASSPSRTDLVELGYNLACMAMVQATALGFTAPMRRSVRAAERLQTEHGRLLAADEISRALQSDFRHRYQRLAETVVPLLQRLQANPDTARDPAIRAACLVESARLRRLFAQVDVHEHPLMAELTPAIELAEKRGVTVTADFAPELPALSDEVAAALLDLPARMLATARTKARIVISTDETGLAVSIISDCVHPGSPPREGIGVHTITVLGDITWLQIDYPIDRPGPSRKPS